MKKIITGIFLIFCLFLNSQTFSYQLTNGETDAIDQVVEIFQKEIIKNNEKMKDALVVKLNEIITRYGFDSRSYEIIRVLIEKVDNLSFKSEVESSNESEKDSEIDSKTNSEGQEEINEENLIQDEDIVYRVDIEKIKETWLEWQNEARNNLGLEEYTYSDKLGSSAQEWSEVLLSRGDLDVEIVHKRDLSDSYYDYNKIASWLKDRGVVCKNGNTTTFSESVAWTGYYCSEDSTDCTQNFIDGLKISFDRYMGERDRTEESRPHYNAIISKYFTTLGMGIAIRQKTPSNYEVFITTHYCTELE